MAATVSTTICCLNRAIQNLMYDLLDLSSRVSYKKTSKACRVFFDLFDNHDSYISNLAKYINKNYEIIGNYPFKGDVRKFLYSPCRVFFWGEYHDRPEHQYLNAWSGNLVYTPDTDNFLEGGTPLLEFERDNRWGLFEYFTPEISAGAKTWDLESEGTVSELFFDATRFDIDKTQQFFLLYLDKEQWSFEKFCGYIDQWFDKDHFFNKEIEQDFWSFVKIKMPTCDKETIQNCHNDPLFREFAIEILKECVCDYIIYTAKRPKLKKEFKRLLILRDNALCEKIEQVIKRGCNASFFAGGAHVDRMHQIYKMRNPLINYMCLQPREDVSMFSIQESINAIFQEIAPSITSSVNSEKFNKTSMQTLAKEEEMLSSEEQINRFIEFDINQLDYRENHYGLWEERMHQLLQQESFRAYEAVSALQKKIKIFLIGCTLKECFGTKVTKIIQEYTETTVKS